MTSFIDGRAALIDALRQELLGPIPHGTPIDSDGDLVFETDEEAYGPFRQGSNDEEIVHRDTPVRRYGLGILYPVGYEHHPEVNESPDAPSADAGGNSLPAADDVPLEGPLTPSEILEGDVGEHLAEAAERLTNAPEEAPDELDLSAANALRPSTVGVSFMAEVPAGSRLRVHVQGGRYRRKKVKVKGTDRWWWLRQPVTYDAEFSAARLMAPDRALLAPDRATPREADGLNLSVVVRSRPETGERTLLTVCLVNRTSGESVVDELCLFQTRFVATIEASGAAPHILAYPDSDRELRDPEARSIALLYRHAQTFAVGHGCSADWEPPSSGGRTGKITAEPFPVVETPSITPDVQVDGQRLVASMAVLAGLHQGRDEWAELEAIIAGYRAWIDDRRQELPTLQDSYRQTGERHLDECAKAADRMEDGLRLLKEDRSSAQAFRLANHAVLLQQLHQRRGVREASYDDTRQEIVFSAPAPSPDPLDPPEGLGEWRAFQIAFLLMSIPSVVERGHPDREVVELIWFPTGGGKTEAYLGLTAFAIFLRRLRNRTDTGLEVLMRYTLRLLTAQQFQRAATLICAMETLRRLHPELGEQRFMIGIWLGGGVTPNTRDDAIQALRALRAGRRDVGNRFLLLKCPWCSAQMGPLSRVSSRRSQGRRRAAVPNVLGYVPSGSTVAFECPDRTCDFTAGLPVLVIDEDIYEEPPSLVIGTVDKFAMLAWRHEARSLFGLDEHGERVVSPPGLIIQDELHLISGPLGSMVGLYESLIENLCGDDRTDPPVRPKIVSSTATIRRYEDQVRSLYARSRVALFPPPGLSASDSFFARWATLKDGSPAPGRIYVGVHSTTLPSMMTTQVRTYAALMQAVQDLPTDIRDPWWTLMTFFSSLRELGTALTLFQSDIPGYLVTIRNRLSVPADQIRRIRNVMELTSRLRSDEIPSKINDLEVTAGSKAPWPVDACLASNIIEVGIDIDRLSLMAVLTQPKTTSTYIQVTGRIGRKWWERPGLVVTLLSPQRPRDRSHYERFRSYHERLYAQVEPTSVTPFSPPALQRALHALMVAYVRQRGAVDRVASPHPVPEELLRAAHDVLRARVDYVDPAEEGEFDRAFQRRLSEWRRWERTAWGRAAVDDERALLRAAGAYVDPARALISWPTPTSLRSIDAECVAKITMAFTQDPAPDEHPPPLASPSGNGEVKDG